MVPGPENGPRRPHIAKNIPIPKIDGGPFVTTGVFLGPPVEAAGSSLWKKLVFGRSAGELGSWRLGGRVFCGGWRVVGLGSEAGGWRASRRTKTGWVAGGDLDVGRTVASVVRLGWRAAGARAGGQLMGGHAPGPQKIRVEQADHRFVFRCAVKHFLFSTRF